MKLTLSFWGALQLPQQRHEINIAVLINDKTHFR